MTAQTKHAKNVLANELGLTKEQITEIIEDRIGKFVNLWLSDKSLEKLIDRSIRAALNEMVKKDRHDYNSLTAIAYQAAKEYVVSGLVVSFREPPK